ncbi:HNH endonuclease signature motif containing protein [Actinoplanes sp. NPDC000266]
MKHWTKGGKTTLDNLVLLCRAHHRLLHHPTAGWEIRLNADGRHDFIPPATLDPARRPRRNVLHHPFRPAAAFDQLRDAA